MYLDGITAGLFVLFAVWILLTSQFDDEADQGTGAMHTDGGVAVVDGSVEAVPARFAGFVPSFSLMTFGEFGDKTQLITIALAAQYGAHPAIWVGEMLAIIPVSIVTALFFSRAASYINMKWVRYGSAGLFVVFGLDIFSKYAFGISFRPL
jgi:putative Ca2+/H+ antiporter (TMEM165/GDT1 family)